MNLSVIIYLFLFLSLSLSVSLSRQAPPPVRAVAAPPVAPMAMNTQPPGSSYSYPSQAVPSSHVLSHVMSSSRATGTSTRKRKSRFDT